MKRTEEQILNDYHTIEHHQTCVICGNSLSKRQYNCWRKTCCKECTLILRKLLLKSTDLRQKISKATKLAMQKEEVKQNMSKANKEVWQRPGYKEKMSNIHSMSMQLCWQQQAFRNDRIASMSTDSYKLNASNAQHQRFSDDNERLKIANSVKLRWKDEQYRKRQELANVKRYTTKKLKGTFNKSKSADRSKEQLKALGFSLEEEKLYPGSKTLHCDIYINELDLWIELHYSQYHNWEPYNANNPKHVKQLKDLWYKFNITPKNHRGSNQYHSIIKNWTDYDVQRRQLAEEHKLNYLCFYSEQAFNEWLTSLNF